LRFFFFQGLQEFVANLLFFACMAVFLSSEEKPLF
jgi:hypothetical protein